MQRYKTLGDEMELPWVDPRDPNYDSDREEAAVLRVCEKDVGKAVEPLMLE